MKKWILSIVVVVLLFTGLLIKVYVKAQEPINSAEKKALTLAKKTVAIKEVDDFHVYHGNDTVSVIEGKAKNGQKIIVWVPEKSKQVIVRKANAGLTKDQAIKKLLQEKSPEKIISVRLGMEKNIPLWEIYYRSKNNLINYYYVHFDTGEWLKKIENF
ncbi:peptidase [Bacillus sp. MUM 116]|uniref:cell wall elongation regulator TseB-like domain-containing protein n=1 Tax=Bacillus sp. MUM 116 TaxID=1678002 RepID=UPI0008F5A5AF|nr:DUF5590 domain-containing protein [Bacillus sp. MUM 116]OIK17098.1 peptidase [Bacillus sp. MUM 116]